MLDSPVVVCSFHTPDPYYSQHADRLRRSLDRLGCEYVIDTVEKADGEDWADICRRKVSYLADICERYPHARVFWIDVDCSLISLPEQIATSTSDLIGFQRGFGSPLGLGYDRRTRFWEPCFFGIAPTPLGRSFIRHARRLEAESQIKATDDYFFEEAWRDHAANISFQIIPSTAALHRADPVANSALPDRPTVTPFFVFGSSGKVTEFKDQVVQHDGPSRSVTSWSRRLRSTSLRTAKRIERALPTPVAARLRRAADNSGMTQALTGGDLDPQRLAGTGVLSPHRQRIVTSMVVAAQRGDDGGMEAAFARLTVASPPGTAEVAARQAAESFLAYARPVQDAASVPLAWWVRPFPGNFGDWLSPLLIQHAAAGAPVHYRPLTATNRDRHIVSVGSVGRFIKPSSVVVGTGISTAEIELDPRAEYVSVRGPVTAAALRASGGPVVESFGDPAVLLRRVIPIERVPTNGRIALVRHFTHTGLPLTLPDHVDELSVLVSHPKHIRSLLIRLAAYDGIVTSAMHIMIAAHSYGIPCALVVFEGLEAAVHGSGIKYRDYALGAEVEPHEPIPVPSDLTSIDLRALMHEERTPEHVLDRVTLALAETVATARVHGHDDRRTVRA